MNELLDIEVILKRDKYPKIYNIGIIGIIIIGIFIILASIYDYRTYLITNARVVNNQLELLIKCDDVKYVVDNNYLMIEHEKYEYKIIRIDNEVVTGMDNNIYQYVYLDISNTLNINNYLYQIRILKEKKKLIKYLKNYL